MEADSKCGEAERQKHDSDTFRFSRTQPLCKKGECIAEAQPYAHVLSLKERGRRCDFCFACSESLKKCTACGVLHYCNVTCQRGDWMLHRKECRCLRRVAPKIPSESVRLMLRLLVRLERGEADKMLENFPGSRTFQDLESHAAEIRKDETRLETFTQLAATLSATVGDLLPLPPPDHLLELFGKMVINTFSICDDDLTPIGSGLYVSLSRLDHSCWPNAAVVFHGTKAVVRATEDIQHCTPSTVFISYIEPLATCRERREQLTQQYYFTCHCRRCENPDEDKLLLSWLCPVSGCSGSVLMDSEKEHLTECSACHSQDFPADFSSSVAQVLKDSKTVIASIEDRKKEGDWESVLQCCEKLFVCQRKVCDVHNVHLLRTLEHAFDACVNLELWQRALDFGQQLSEPHRKLLSWPCPSVAVQRLRLGKLQLFLQHLNTALKTLTMALDMLVVTHSQGHPVTAAAVELLHQCREELRGQGD